MNGPGSRGRGGAALLVGLVLTLAPLGASARAAEAPDPALAGRLEPGVAAEVTRAVRAARAAGLPDEPLISTALEGASRGATPDRIVRAVRRLAGELERARAALGGRSRPEEIVAGASALRAGIATATLGQLRALRPAESVVVPLVVYGDFVVRRVPPERAASAVLDLTRAGARDEDLIRLRERVAQDIGAGATPVDAVALRTRGAALELAARQGATPASGGSGPGAARVP